MFCVASIFGFALTFNGGCGLNCKPAASPAPQSNVRSRGESQTSEASRKELQNGRVRRTSSKITITPTVHTIRPREMNLANGRTQVLSIPIALTNTSPQEIRIKLPHEWYGGVWLLTDLYVSVKLSGTEETIWTEAPAYRVGEKGSADSETRLKPAETKTFDIRLNWPGTGSIPTTPLIDVSQPGKYSIKFLLFFKTNGSKESLESQAVDIEVQK